MQRSGRLVFTIILLIFIIVGGLLVLWLNLQDTPEPLLPTIRPTDIVEVASPTPSPTASQTVTPTTSPTPTQAPTETPFPSPTMMPSVTVPPMTSTPSLPPLPQPVSVEVALAGDILGSGTLPTYGRFGGLYDNQFLINAGHVMITVPNEPDVFHIDVFEVSNTQLFTFLNASNLTAIPLIEWQSSEWVTPDGAIRRSAAGIWEVGNPRNNWLAASGVSALTARAYCNNIGGRLPTLAEWERAAYWEQDAPPRAYPWGNAPVTHSLANFDSDEIMPRTALENGRSWVGAYHMAGNVAEWVQLATGDFAVIGGSYLDDAVRFEVALHTPQVYEASLPLAGVGFRCVR